MRALLLAAGKGTRLRPITKQVPKCLVPIQNRPLLEYWLDLLIPAGVSPVLLNMHYMAEQVQSWLEDCKYKEEVVAVYEEELLGTAGTVLANRDFFKNSPFMLVHADNLSCFSVEDFLFAHKNRPSGCVMTMMLFQAPSPKDAGIVELDAQNRVVAFHEKVSDPPGSLANAAVYIIEPEVLGFIASFHRRVLDFSVDIIPHFLGRIFSYVNNAYHRDIGTPQSYEKAQIEYPVFVRS